MIAVTWAEPDELLRGEDYSATAEIWTNGVAADVGSTSASLLKPDGTIAQTITASVMDNVATAVFAGSSTSGESPGDGWLIRWSITVDGAPRRFQNAASVVLYEAVLVVTADVLLKRATELEDILADDTARAELLQDVVSEAWFILRQLLRQKGRRPYLIVDSTSLREPVILKALSLAYQRVGPGEATPEWSKYLDYDRQFIAAWESVTFAEADPSTYLPTGSRVGVRGPLWLGSGAGTGRWRPVSPGPGSFGPGGGW